MRPDKAKKLQQLLAKLSSRQAMAVARGIETERALGAKTLPSEAILNALRPQLRHAGAKRVPTLKRLACLAFEDFLTDRDDDPRPPGLIARAAVDPWWQALNHVAGAEIAELEAELRQMVARDDEAGLALLGDTVARAARGWTEGVLARLESRKGSPALKKLFLDPLLLGDLREIARVLPLGGAVRSGIDAVIRVAGEHGEAQGRRLLDLGPATVTEAKLQYLRLSDAFGVDASYFALGLLNKLERAWAILRLGRALSWKPNDAMVRDTEFGVIGERLIADLRHQAKKAVSLARAGDAADNLPPLLAQLSAYFEDAEGLLGEFGFRRDSAWGEAILATRAEVARAVADELAPRVGAAMLEVMPQTQRPGARRLLSVPDLAREPESRVTGRAVEGARFLRFLQQRGARHGLGVAVREVTERVGAEIDRRAGQLLDELRVAPENPIIPAQIGAAQQVLDTLFDDGRGAVLARRLRNAQAAAKPEGGVYGLLS
ncbi:MAG TPA: hypothetical protein VE397_18095 [Stellaceae bacterium]|nr:hypothetical protein [Stellaceae bacterium]